MPTDSHFRWATCLTLVLAVAGLGYSEWDLVPGVAAFTVFIVGLIVAAFALDRRVTVGRKLANVIGMGIGAASTAWLVWQFNTFPEGFSALMLQPGLMLPFVGPFLMVLIPAKLFRPKHLGDWWTMQGLGLAGIALGASMSETGLFAAILVAYVASALWSVSILYLRTASGMIDPIPRKHAAIAPPPEVHSPNSGFRKMPLARFLAVATLVVFLASLPLFLLVPRSTAERWAFGKSRIETGFSPENSHDINKTGDVNVSRDVALRVTATEADGSPKLDLLPNNLWRGISYSDYEDGKWVRRSYPSSTAAVVRTGRLPLNANPPQIGAGAYQLEFHPEDAGTGSVIESPVRWKAGVGSPVRSVGRIELIPWLPLYDGSFVPENVNRRRLTYRQWSLPRSEPDLGEAFELSETSQLPRVRTVLTAVRVQAIRDWAVALLAKLEREERIPTGVLADSNFPGEVEVKPRHSEAVARAFADYFSTSPEFAYTLKLRRQDRRLDAVEDFLTNTKAGHCQWFASALCLTLRAVGVPAQFVMGYKGYETLDDGTYLIRQEHAHAWVEVMVPRRAPEGFVFRDAENAREGTVWHWLSLDPAPAASETASNSGWFDTTSWRTTVISLVDFVLKYDSDKRNEVAQTAPRRLAQIGMAIAALFVLVFAVRRIRRILRRRSTVKAVRDISVLPWYRELVRILAKKGIARRPGQTPKEFAEQVGLELQAEHPEAAGIPAFVTSKFYRVRFAGVPLTGEETEQVEAALRDLDRKLNG